MLTPHCRFPLPEVPAGWKPDPQRVWDAGENKENATPAKVKQEPPRTHAEWKASLLSADKVQDLRPRSSSTVLT